MVWMPSRCPVCGSDLRRASSMCDNQENNGNPCLGMDATEAALYDARRKFAADRIDLAEFERRVEAALKDPPKRRFGSILVLR